MNSITFIPTDKRIKNAVIRQICKENNINKDKIYCNDTFNYMDYDNDISITLLSTIYKGINYSFKYFSGCFNAYMVANVIDYTFEVNNYGHYLLYNNEGIKVHIEAGWKINNDAKKLYTNFLNN